MTLSVPNFRRHLSSAFFILTNCRLKRLSYVKLKDWIPKQRRSRWDVSMSRLFWIYAVCKSLLLSPMAVKELIRITIFAIKYLLIIHHKGKRLVIMTEIIRRSGKIKQTHVFRHHPLPFINVRLFVKSNTFRYIKSLLKHPAYFLSYLLCVIMFIIYNSLSRIPRASLKHYKISVPRHIRFSELRKK